MAQNKRAGAAASLLRARTAKLTGDGVAVPVVRWFAKHLIEPLEAGIPLEDDAVIDLPLVAAPTKRKQKIFDPALANVGCMKTRTVGTTLYILPGVSADVRQLAAKLGITVHEMAIRGLDRILGK
jgi:hypothetical protein